MTSAPNFPRAGLDLLRQLARNNTTAWFAAHRNDYRALVQEPARQIAAFVNAELQTFAPAYVNEQKNPLSRPNRDTRFSKDKSPYRTDVSVVFPRRGLEKHEAAGFFFRISPTGAELIAGTYMPGPEQLARLRRHLDRQHLAFRKLMLARPIADFYGELRGEQLKRVPRGFDPQHPAEALLRMTQFYLSRALPATVITAPGFAADIVRGFRVAHPFVQALDGAMGNK